MTQPDLDLRQSAELAAAVESAQRELARLRYGSILTVGTATVVLNPDCPLPGWNFASHVTGSPAAAEATLRRLPAVFGAAGLAAVTVVSSASSLPELDAVAEETGYLAVDEQVTRLLVAPERLPEEPGDRVRPLAEEQEGSALRLLAESSAPSAAAARALVLVYGHLLDDPRTVAVAVATGTEVSGVGIGFHQAGLGLVGALSSADRSRTVVSLLAGAVTTQLLAVGAERVAAVTDSGRRLDQQWSAIGFEPATDGVVYRRRLPAS